MEEINRQAGFTFIELMVVISIISLLASIVLASVVDARNSSKNAVLISDLVVASQALSLYKQDTGDYPPADTVSDDTLASDLGNDCSSGQTGWQAQLVSSNYLGKSFYPPTGATSICYFHLLVDNGIHGEAQIEYNYCSMGLACGFSGTQFPDYISCVSGSDRNPDNSRDIPSSKAAIFFWLIKGLSKSYPQTGSNPWYNPPGNAMCIN